VVRSHCVRPPPNLSREARSIEPTWNLTGFTDRIQSIPNYDGRPADATSGLVICSRG
jgi:hypothetical protein